jgi:hypothetical protein
MISDHDIQKAQGIERCSGKFYIKGVSKEPFINKGIETFNEVGRAVYHELINSENSKIHKSHYIMLGNMKVMEIVSFTTNRKNPIREINLKRELCKLNISTIIDLCRPGQEFASSLIREVRDSIPVDVRHSISNREQLERDETVMRLGELCIAIHLNLQGAAKIMRQKCGKNNATT